MQQRGAADVYVEADAVAAAAVERSGVAGAVAARALYGAHAAGRVDGSVTDVGVEAHATVGAGGGGHANVAYVDFGVDVAFGNVRIDVAYVHFQVESACEPAHFNVADAEAQTRGQPRRSFDGPLLLDAVAVVRVANIEMEYTAAHFGGELGLGGVAFAAAAQEPATVKLLRLDAQA